MKGNPAIVFLTSADTEVLAMRTAAKALPPDFPSVAVLHAAALTDEEQINRTIQQVIHPARVVVMRLLGGRASFRPLFEGVTSTCSQQGIPLMVFPGDLQFDPEYTTSSSVSPDLVKRMFGYLMHGGARNLLHLLFALSDAFLGSAFHPPGPTPLPWDGIYHPDAPEGIGLEEFIRRYWRHSAASVGLLFYRAYWVSADLEWIDAFIRLLEKEGLNVLPIFVYSLRPSYAPQASGDPLRRYLLDPWGNPRVDALITTLGYTIATVPGDPMAQAEDNANNLDTLSLPVIQAMVCTQSRSHWENNPGGLAPLEAAIHVALPEFDGRIISVPVAFKERVEETPFVPFGVRRTIPHRERMRFVARLAARFTRLRRIPNAQKRVAILLSNYPNKLARIGNAVGLDTPASLLELLYALRGAGYHVLDIPASAEELMERLTACTAYDPEFRTPAQWRLAVGDVDSSTSSRWFAELPEKLKRQLRAAWGEPPGTILYHRGGLSISGFILGNIFVGVQPPRGFGENPIAIYHSPELPPTHHYLATYRWLQEVFGADAVIHLGKHGNLEWLPGKSLALSSECWPEAVLSDLPHFYPFIINNPGEGTQAKRRTHATIVDHLIPPMTRAETYNELARLEQMLDEHARLTTLDPAKLPWVEAQIRELVKKTHLDRDLALDRSHEDFSGFIRAIDGYLCELKSAQIRDGLHVLGQPPSGEQEVGLLAALTRLDNGDLPGLPRAIGQALGIDPAELRGNLGEAWRKPLPPVLRALDETPVRTRGDIQERIDGLGRRLIRDLQSAGYRAAALDRLLAQDTPNGGLDTPVLREVLEFICQDLVPRIHACRDEIQNLLRGLDGHFVPPGPSGAPTRGMANVLPTGRNFYSVDIRAIPSPTAWRVGVQSGEELIAKYLRETGAYPRCVGMTLWGTSTMRTTGDELAQALWLLGVKPVWQPESRRVVGLEVIPLEKLQRPRIDVVVRVSGFFRDAFPGGIHLLDRAVEMVASLEEDPQANIVRAHIEEEFQKRIAGGEAPSAARRRAAFRVFSSKPGTYGTGMLALIESGRWKSDQDLAEVFIRWGAYAYTREAYGQADGEAFQARLARVCVAVKHQDNREHDIFDSDDYFQFHGGMIAAVRAETGKSPRAYFADTADPQRASVRDLADEARRVLRTRVVNPKWIEGVKRHGYKGAFELAATVDYLFGYDATAHILEDWMYEEVARAYVLDPVMRVFFRRHNPWALRDTLQRLLEAMERHLWRKPSEETRRRLESLLLETEGWLEQGEEVSTPRGLTGEFGSDA